MYSRIPLDTWYVVIYRSVYETYNNLDIIIFPVKKTTAIKPDEEYLGVKNVGGIKQDVLPIHVKMSPLLFEYLELYFAEDPSDEMCIVQFDTFYKLDVGDHVPVPI